MSTWVRYWTLVLYGSGVDLHQKVIHETRVSSVGVYLGSVSHALLFAHGGAGASKCPGRLYQAA